MKKREAFEIAKRFREDHPELTDRTVRICQETAAGYNAHTELRLVPRGPRGGMQPTRRISSGNNCTMINVLRSGDVLIRADYRNGWPDYQSYPVLPHDECGDYASKWEPEFSTEEKLVSVKWAIENLPSDPELGFHLDKIQNQLQYQLESDAAWEASRKRWEANHAQAMGSEQYG